MSRHRLHVSLIRNEGALLRLLGTTERRGFPVESLHVQPHPTDAGLWSVELTVQSLRDITLLQRQLERLVDVDAITSVPCA